MPLSWGFGLERAKGIEPSMTSLEGYDYHPLDQCRRRKGPLRHVSE